MEFFKIRRDIPFMEHALVFNIVSFLTFAAAVFFLVPRGLHLSVEFTGGTVMEVGYSQAADVEKVRRTVAEAGPVDILLVAYGAPHQEKGIARNLPHMDVRLAMGVGGVFDFLSGRLPRAPRWIREAGFDWLYRLTHEPRRLRRQLTIPQFLALIAAKRLGGYRGTFLTRNLSGDCTEWAE